MHNQKDEFSFTPDGIYGPSNALPNRGTVRMFGGINPAAQLNVEGYHRTYSMFNSKDRDAMLANPAAPAVGSGTEWTSTTIGGASTLTLQSAFPAALRVVTAAVDGQGTQFQCNVLGALFDMQVGSFLKEAYYAITMRVNDITQSEFFVGFAPTDTNLITTLDDFVGIAKNDDETVVKLVASGTSVATPHAAGSVLTIGDLATLDATGTTAANDWLTFAIRIRDSVVHAGIFNGYKSLGKQPAVHRGSLALPALGAASAPSFAFVAGSAAARTYEMTSVVVGAKYGLGGMVRA